MSKEGVYTKLCSGDFTNGVLNSYEVDQSIKLMVLKAGAKDSCFFCRKTLSDLLPVLTKKVVYGFYNFSLKPKGRM